MKFKDYVGVAGTKKLKDAIERLLEADSGFVILATNTGGKLVATDLYMGICRDDTLRVVNDMVEDAQKIGLLAECTCSKEN